MSISSRIEYVQSGDLLEDPVPRSRAPAPGLGVRRRLAGLALAALGLPLLTLLLDGAVSGLSLEGQVLLYLLAVVVVAVVGGMVVAVVSAVAAALLINYFFVAPVHTLDVAHADQAVALVVFVVVAAVVSGAVEVATRRARAAQQAADEAETLSALAGGELDEEETLRAVLQRARQTFRMESVVLKHRERPTGDWVDVVQAGWGPPGSEAPMRFDVPISPDLRLLGRGPELFAEDHRVLQAFAAAAQTAFEGRRLTEEAREARNLATVDRQRTALLAAVGHDLRTPLAGIKASVSTLRQTDVSWSDSEREELLATIEDSADRLEGVVANLLDASRLEAGALSVRTEPVALDELVGAAVAGLSVQPGRVTAEVPADLPLVSADAGLLERVLSNVLDNALHHGDSAVEVIAYAGAGSVKLEIVDHGPGVSARERERLFEPFQRLDDRDTGGVGLGLTVARGFVEAMGGAMAADNTQGGGLTIRMRLPVAA
ncbi:MAG: two-component system, OmpR family, sensor histidine kinase KdpD [Solirubrobacteraceae bacterium]|jgi:K+-sensing histidine kinase KdpD|nr:two-component system, OmpR family, sensor histidine kinase KdpD [Solirubrobacteraceae bacterium]